MLSDHSSKKWAKKNKCHKEIHTLSKAAKRTCAWPVTSVTKQNVVTFLCIIYYVDCIMFIIIFPPTITIIHYCLDHQRENTSVQIKVQLKNTLMIKTH